MSVVAVIPARYGSTRLAAKALLRETGKYLVQHVYERAKAARRIDRVVVATDDERIVAAVKSFGGDVRMTRADHQSGTDRVAEVAEALGLGDDDLVLNVQGDEPEMEAETLDGLVDFMEDRQEGNIQTSKRPNVQTRAKGDQPRRESATTQDRLEIDDRQGDRLETGPTLHRLETGATHSPQFRIGTVAVAFEDEGPREGMGSPLDPNCVKVVVDAFGRAVYFSRSLIPYPRDTGGVVDRPSRWLLHLGVYAFRADALREICARATKREATERRSDGATMGLGRVIANSYEWRIANSEWRKDHSERGVASIDNPTDRSLALPALIGGGSAALPDMMDDRSLGLAARIAETESLEQLRWLISGYDIGVVIGRRRSMGIDTPEQYAAFVEREKARVRRG